MMILLGLLAIIGVLIYTYFTWNDDYFSRFGVPFKKPAFFFGNLKDVFTGKKHIGIVITDFYKKFDYAPFFGMFQLRDPTLVIRDLDLIKAVLIKDFNSFANNDIVVDSKTEPILMANPFVLTGETWKAMRGAWSATMTSSKLKIMHETMLEKSNRMISYLKDCIEKNPENPLEARELATQYLTDNIVTGVLGLECNSFENPNNVFREIAISVFVSDFWEGITNILFSIAPKLLSLFKISFMKKQTEKNLRSITKQIIDANNEGILKNSFLTSMIKENLNEDEIAGRVFGFLSEGIETSSGLISFTLYELAANPDVQQKLREELNASANANDGVISYDQIHNLPYFDKVIAEVNRLHPAALKMSRTCTIPYKLETFDGNVFNVPTGMTVSIPIYAIHLDEKYYPNPEKFDPERFSEEAIAARHKMAYMPFGEGPRICVGMRLALTQSKTAIAAIIRNFNLSVSSKTMPEPLPVDPNILVNRPTGGLWINFSNL